MTTSVDISRAALCDPAIAMQFALSIPVDDVRPFLVSWHMASKKWDDATSVEAFTKNLPDFSIFAKAHETEVHRRNNSLYRQELEREAKKQAQRLKLAAKFMVSSLRSEIPQNKATAVLSCLELADYMVTINEDWKGA